MNEKFTDEEIKKELEKLKAIEVKKNEKPIYKSSTNNNDLKKVIKSE